jgi:bacterioferritin-associated ferredoxin
VSVTRCVCHRRTFAELKHLAHEQGWQTVAEISLETSCGLGCGACRPYLQAMLDTGATAFTLAQGGAKPLPTTPAPWEVGG